MTTQRDVFQASCYAALARHTQAIGDGVWRPTADNQLVDALLKAWERSLHATGRAHYGHRGLPAQASPEAAAARIRAQVYGDTPEDQAARRADLDAYGVRRRA